MVAGGALQWGVQSESSAACWSKRVSSSEWRRPVRRMVVGITGCLVPSCSRARIRPMETLGRASGSLTFGLNTNACRAVGCCVRNVESCWGSRGSARRVSGVATPEAGRTGSPARDDVVAGSQETKLSVMRSPRGLVHEPGCAMRLVPWQVNARCASANNPYGHRFGIGSYSRRIGG